MICPGCAHENRAGAKFCEECAAALPRACASCGAELRASAKFCDECGAPVAAGATSTTRTQGAEGAAQRGEAERSPISGARKVVTIVFADLVGSTALHERLDAESVRAFMESYYVAMRSAVDAHGGRVTQVMGDGVKAVFGAPRVAEDDAIRAVRAAVAMQRAFRALAEQQASAVGKTGLRVAVNTGEVIADGESEIIGDPVNVAARLQEQGRDGDVVIGEATQRIVSTLITVVPLGSFALKGRAEPVKAHRVVSLEPPEGIKAAAFVGREHELARLDAVHQAGLVAPRARLAVLLGSPGLGKSRLIDEFARRLGDSATVISAHCDATGGATFAPLAKALRAHFGLDDAASAEALRAALEAALPSDDAERARIAGGVAALLAGTPAAPEESFFVVRRLLGALAAAKPVVLVIDDLHWAEPLLLDLIEHLVRWGAGARLMLLVGARPELRDTRVSLTTPGGPVADVVTLAGLDASAAMRLAASVIGAEDLPTAVAAKLLAASEGNPLFVGELVRMLVEEGALRREGERWTIGAGLAQLEMPPTIHALLAARIERLRPEERSVIEHAAVIGRHFSRSAVAALMPGDVRNLDARIESLWRSELIEPDTGWFLGEPALRFHHVLIRDAAYRRLLKHTRVDLHARHAEWIEARAGEDGAQDETLGWHFEQAHQCLRELGPIDARGRKLGERAAKHLAAAGRRALARDDLPLAASLLGRALDRLDPSDAARADLALDWCEALLSAGDVGPAAGAIDELGRFTGDSERLRAWHTCFAGQRSTLTDPQSLNATALAVAAAAEALAKLGDAAGEAKAHQVHAQALFRLGRVGAGEAALDRALAAARRPGGDRRRANAVLAGAPLAALWGPSPVTRASGRCLDVVRVLRITQDAPAVEAIALSCQGVLEALRGRTDAARRMVASSRKMVEELGIANRLFEADVFAGRIDLLEGDAVAAEGRLRSAYDGQRELGLGVDAAQTAALLARALLAQGRAAEAEALSHESEALAGDGLQAGIAWRGVRAEALARRGEHAAAVALAEAAVEIASATDALLDHADARLALAAALRAAGRNNEASAEERRAIELWEAKGATLLAERARGNATRAEIAMPTPAAQPAPPTAIPRRVRPNAATRSAARIEAALGTRDLAAFAALHASDFAFVDHVNGLDGGGGEALRTFETFLRYRDARFRIEPHATLGESLALCRQTLEARGGEDGSESADVGEFRGESFVLHETDSAGRLSRLEVLRDDKLGDAIARLYARYAELLPEGAERTRAEATAHSVAMICERPFDLARFAACIDPSIEIADGRSVGTGPVKGAEAVLRSTRTILDLSEAGVDWRIDDLFGATPDALWIRHMSFGAERVGGGSWERDLREIWVFGTGGKIARWEKFDPGQDAEALARFDALTSAAEPALTPARRVRENAATRCIEQFTGAIAARDRTALAKLCDDALRVVHHTTRAEYGRRELLGTWRSILRAKQLGFRSETIASLGDSLALERHWLSIEGLAEEHVAAFGRSEFDELVLFHVSQSGQLIHMEIFAGSKLSHALSHLYERHAESLSAGRERTRAEAIARSATVMLGQPDLAATAMVLAPGVEFTDLRTVGFGTLRGAATVIDTIAAMMKLSSGDAAQVDDVLVLEADALVVRWTNRGTDRATGGVFERKLCQLFTFGSDGLVTRWQQFEVEHAAEALARFDELTATSHAMHPQQLAAGFENAASRADAELMRCFNARDWAGVLACVGPRVAFDERRRLTRNTADREAWLGQFRFLFDVPESRFTIRPLATRGERLCLHRHEFDGLVADGGGPLALDPHLTLHEVDRDGRIFALVLFDLDAEAAAHAELDARFEAGEGAAHAGALAFSRALDRAFENREWDVYAGLFSPDFSYRDHRLLGWAGTMSDRRSAVVLQRSLVELAPDVRIRNNHVRLCERGVLKHMAHLGTRDGGDFEKTFFTVQELDAEGRALRADTFDVEQQGQARARFEEIAARTAAPPRSEPFANAASRSVERETRAFAARDWESVVALVSPAVRFHDRRRMLYAETGYEGHLAQYRLLFDQPTSRWRQPLLATRGERLSLHRVSYEAEVAGGGGSLAFDDFLCVVEVDVDGRWIAVVNFDLDAEDAAYAELDARWDAQLLGTREREWAAATSRHFRLINDRDWDAFHASCAPEVARRDHRRLGMPPSRGPRAVVDALRAMTELAPDVLLYLDHRRCAGRGELWQMCWRGNRDGGAFEIPMLGVRELDEQDRMLCLDLYDLEDWGQARARFEEIAARTAPASDASPSRFENAASRAWRTAMAAWVARDAARWEQHHHAFVRYRDHRRLMQLDYNREQLLEFTRPLLEMRSASASLELLATRGERLALMRLTLEVADDAAGASVIESLILIETNAAGAVVETQRWDMDDLDAAYAELDARFEASERAWMPAFCRALARRDWDAVSALCADGLIAEDHRMVGWGSLQGPAADMMTLRSMVELAPDARIRLDHLRTLERGELFESKWLGTRDGGAFEIPNVGVTELDEQGRQIRLDLYDPEKLDRARARFDEFAARSAARDPLRIPPNAASDWLQRFRTVFNARDWEAARTLYAADATYEDRQRFSRLSGGLDLMLSSLRERANAGAMLERIELLGTAGDRVAVQRVLWAGGSGGDRFEMEFLCVQVVDEHGRLSANVNFDLGDARAARREAWARWAGIEPELAAAIAQSGEGFDAWNERDPARLRPALADDLVVEDHRREGIGRIESADAYLASVSALYELSTDSRVELVTWLAVGSHGSLTIARREGSVFNEGGAYESVYLLLCLFTSGRTTRMEMFELEERDAALARFAELGRESKSSAHDPLRIPPNAATRALDRWYAGTASGDMEAVRALYADSNVLDDRRALVGGTFGPESVVPTARFFSEGWRWVRTLLATAGDRLALWRILFTTTEAGAASEIEILEVDEVDREGRIMRVVLFDPDARAAASDELFESYVRLGADGMLPSHIEMSRATAAPDPARMRAALPDSFFVEDRRRLGLLGRLDRDAWVASIAAMVELSREVRIDELYQVAVAPYARLGVGRTAGLNAEGGEFETFVVWLNHYENGEYTGIEVFDPEALDTARARFEELGRSAAVRDPLQIPPNAATRLLALFAPVFASADWDAQRAMASADFRFEDRTRRALVSGDVEVWIRSGQYLRSEAGAGIEARLLSTLGERIEIHSIVLRDTRSGDDFEIEGVHLTEVDAAGKLRAFIRFDPEDRAAAFEEAEARFIAGEAAAIGGQAPIAAMNRAIAHQDWHALRESLTADFEMRDLRMLGHGVLAGEAWIDSMRALARLGSRVRVEYLRLLAWNRHGRVTVARTAGLNESGGEFEILAIGVLITEGDRVARIERYDLADTERALARFEALCAESEARA